MPRMWAKDGSCSWGDKCKFAHGSADSGTKSPDKRRNRKGRFSGKQERKNSAADTEKPQTGSGKNKDKTCFNCGKEGHFKNKCPQAKEKKADAGNGQEGIPNKGHSSHYFFNLSSQGDPNPAMSSRKKNGAYLMTLDGSDSDGSIMLLVDSSAPASETEDSSNIDSDCNSVPPLAPPS